jgi:hypothetical protein
MMIYTEKLGLFDDQYHQREYPKSNPEIDASKHKWSNYFLYENIKQWMATSAITSLEDK